VPENVALYYETMDECLLYSSKHSFLVESIQPIFFICITKRTQTYLVSVSLPPALVSDFLKRNGFFIKSLGIDALQRAHLLLCKAVPLAQRKQKTWEHGSCTGCMHCCKQIAHSSNCSASPAI